MALLAYFTDKLGSKGDLIFQNAEKLEVDLVISEIVIGETIYTIRKGKEIFGVRIAKELQDTIIMTLFQSPMYRIVSLKLAGWQWFLKSKIPELHDRMIAAICIQENTRNLITTDQEIEENSEIKIIW